MKRQYYPTAFENFLFRFPSLLDEEWDSDVHTSGLSIYEENNHICIEAALPGMTDHEIDITYEKGCLMIEAEKKEETQKEKKYYRKANRKFSYRVMVPGDIDESIEPEATFSQGIMTIKFKKNTKVSKKKIQIKK